MKRCEHCGTQNPDFSVFCSECGKPLPKGPKVKKEIAKTMLSTAAPKFDQPPKTEEPAAPQAAKATPATQVMPAMQAPPAAQAAQAAPLAAKATPAKPKEEKKTMIGMAFNASQVTDADGKQAQAAPSAAVAAKASRPRAPEPATPDTAKEAAKEAAGKTMLGVSPIATGGAPQAPGAVPADLSLGKTVQGDKPVFEPIMESPVMAPDTRPSQAPRPMASFQPQPQPVHQAQPPQSEEIPPGAMKVPQADPRSRAQAPPEGIKLEHGQPAPSTSARAPGMSRPSLGPHRIGSTTMLMVRKAAAVPRWLIVLIIVVVVVGVGLGYVIKRFVLEPMKPRATRISIEQNPDFQSVNITAELVNVDDVANLEITKKKFKVEKGKALITLPIGPVRLGSNSIEAALLDKKGQDKGTLALDFELVKFWQPQLQTLDDEKNPVVGLYFQTLPDASLVIDGNSSPGEGPGKFLYTQTIKQLMKKAPAADADMWKVSFDYELTSKKAGGKDKGTVEIEIPTVRLQIDRPPDGVKVVDDKVECIGKTDADAEVTINGSPVDVNSGKFAITIPLPSPGVFEIKIEAFSPKRGPRAVSVKVERVGDMEAEIGEFKDQVEKDLTWEKLSREPTVYKGKKVAYQGRIFNIRTEKGVTAFQMLVSEGCPDGARCTLVATFRGETSAGEQSLVTVLGEVTGVQTLQTATGSKFDAPQIEAKFVVPQQDKKKKKKKGK
ncbi:MAG: zinc-ribbon domain-containing protein [Pseudomonadota bacterium]